MHATVYVTVRAKTSLVHTSDSVTLMAHKIGWELQNNFIFAEFVDQASLNHCYKFELSANFQKKFTDLYFYKIGGVN